jgi:hypothetical protein
MGRGHVSDPPWLRGTRTVREEQPTETLGGVAPKASPFQAVKTWKTSTDPDYESRKNQPYTPRFFRSTSAQRELRRLPDAGPGPRLRTSRRPATSTPIAA